MDKPAAPTVNRKELIMKYLLMCQTEAASFENVSAADEAAFMQSMMAYNQQLIQAGVLVAAGQLAPAETAKRVFRDKGRIKKTAGANTNIGGYYLIDVASEPDATSWAAKCPIAQFGALEVRQVMYSPM
jgi:hypothetical protein